MHPPSQLTTVTTHDLKSRNGKINSLRPSDIYALINKVITSSDNGLSLVPQQPIAWTNAAAGINLSKIWIKKKIIKNYMKMLYAKYIPLCLGLYVLHMTTHHDNAGKNNPEETKRQSSIPESTIRFNNTRNENAFNILSLIYVSSICTWTITSNIIIIMSTE